MTYIDPGKINMESDDGALEDAVEKNGVIFRFHANFQGCICQLKFA